MKGIPERLNPRYVAVAGLVKLFWRLIAGARSFLFKRKDNQSG